MSRLREALDLTNEYTNWRTRVLDTLLVVEFIAAVLVALVTVPDLFTGPTAVTWTYLAASAGLMALSGGLLWGRKRLSYAVRANGFLVLFFSVSLSIW